MVGQLNDPAQARIVEEQLTRTEWPTCSPSLNPIELLWDQLGSGSHETACAEYTGQSDEIPSGRVGQVVPNLSTVLGKQHMTHIAATG